MSKTAMQAKADCLKKDICAKKIQRSFRGYLSKQAQIERELAEEEANRERQRE